MMRAIVCLLFAGAMFGQAPAQDQTPAPQTPPQVLRVFQIKNADVERLARIIDVFGARVRPDTALRVISVSGTEEQVKAIEDAIRRYDVPPPGQKNVELTFYLLQATVAPGTEKLPSDLEPVVKQLRATFNYQGYRLADTVQVRARNEDGFEASSTASFASPFPNAPETAGQLKASRVTVGTTGEVSVIRLDNLRIGVRLPFCYEKRGTECGSWQFKENGVNTSIDIREGQKVVVGKTANGSDSAIIVVVTAKVVI